MFLAQRKRIALGVRKSLSKSKGLELRLVGAQLKYMLDNGSMLSFEKSANVWRDKVS